MIDLAARLSSLPNARPLSSLPFAWEWSPAPGFVLLAALSTNQQWAYRLNTKDSYDEELCLRILEFVRENEAEVIDRPEPLIAISGFKYPGREFDVVGRIRPESYELFPNDPELSRVVFGVFPGYSSEISGFESADQASERFYRMLKTSDLNRKPVPYALVRFSNPKTGAGTIGDLPVFTSPEYLLHELLLLEGVEAAYLELWNHRNEKWRVQWDVQWIARNSQRELRMSSDEISQWAATVLK